MLAIKVPLNFLNYYYEIDNIMKQYVYYLSQIKMKGMPLLIPYDPHTTVRALETLFYQNFSCVSGMYESIHSSVSAAQGAKVSRLIKHSCEHSWLELKEDPRFILDVIPVYGVFGLTPVVPIMLDNNVFGYMSSGGVDPKHWSEEQNQKMREDVNELSDLFQGFASELSLG